MDLTGPTCSEGTALGRPMASLGDTFSMKINRLGRDYLMINHVVEFARSLANVSAPEYRI